jgi:hypothetical protein
LFAHACALGTEGIVSKKVDGTYPSGPSGAICALDGPDAFRRNAFG